MSVLGIDLAAEPKKTYACVLEARDRALHAAIHRSCDDERLIELAAGKEKVGIDAPFGWPRPFVEALVAHRDREAWPAPATDPKAFRRTLSFRATDLHIMQTRRPLSVSTDKLGVTAMRCAHLLHRWVAAGETVDRSGGGTFVEVYPAAALARWGFEPGGYKGSGGTGALGALADRLFDALPMVLEPDDKDLCRANDDAFDALVAALVTRAAALGTTDGPPADVRELAEEEGWIHLPRAGARLIELAARATRSPRRAGR